jgi:tetratricopeptide (TPR) repeat protein
MQALRYLAASGYNPGAAADIWEQLRAEMDSSTQGRLMRRIEDAENNFFASHPSTKQRMDYLRGAASKINGAGKDLGEDRYRQSLAGWWPQLIDDQIKLADFGVTEFLLKSIARDRWTAGLHYARGELYRARASKADFATAVSFYQSAIALDPGFAESWRGLGLSLLRQGDTNAGKMALKEYLARRVDAPDKALIAAMADMP